MKKTTLVTGLLFITFYFFPLSCSSRKMNTLDAESVTNTKVVKEIIKDTIIKIEADNSYYKAWIECRDGKPIILNNNPKTKETSQSKNGKYIKAPQVKLEGNVLEIDCEAKARELFHKWKENHTQEVITKNIYIEKPLKFWQKGFIWIGGLYLLLTAIVIVLKVKNKL